MSSHYIFTNTLKQSSVSFLMNFWVSLSLRSKFSQSVTLEFSFKKRSLGESWLCVVTITATDLSTTPGATHLDRLDSQLFGVHDVLEGQARGRRAVLPYLRQDKTNTHVRIRVQWSVTLLISSTPPRPQSLLLAIKSECVCFCSMTSL